MDHRTVEEGLLGESEIGDGVPVVEAFHVRPVLLGADRSPLAVPAAYVECFREDLVEITLVTGNRGAIREG